MKKSKRDLVIKGEHYTIVIGLCTHLGCIPTWKKISENAHVMEEFLIQVEKIYLDHHQDL